MIRLLPVFIIHILADRLFQATSCKAWPQSVAVRVSEECCARAQPELEHQVGSGRLRLPPGFWGVCTCAPVHTLKYLATSVPLMLTLCFARNPTLHIPLHGPPLSRGSLDPGFPLNSVSWLPRLPLQIPTKSV